MPSSACKITAERVQEPRLGLRPDAGNAAQPARRRRLAKLVDRAHAERASELERTLRAETEVATEADQIGRELTLELGQLGDGARLDELAQPRFDPRADPAQLAHMPRAHQLADRQHRAADRLGG